MLGTGDFSRHGTGDFSRVGTGDFSKACDRWLLNAWDM
jgi:hypothetical protein